ncbi:hypothetical protein B0I35DRAFT_406143 [Stachybotrys elegans]|uniref:Uncharacterized protein n=1 Tax=Stachybotrys elegans TaxID=80388 RepID=A0A8K0SV75_9HYPO|nr:hypothetical protein B0I35DRAFT_406143 [Stachybotrys elegans]
MALGIRRGAIFQGHIPDNSSLHGPSKREIRAGTTDDEVAELRQFLSTRARIDPQAMTTSRRGQVHLKKFSIHEAEKLGPEEAIFILGQSHPDVEPTGNLVPYHLASKPLEDFKFGPIIIDEAHQARNSPTPSSS